MDTVVTIILINICDYFYTDNKKKVYIIKSRGIFFYYDIQ